MNRIEAKEFLPLMQAYAEGKTIQQRRQVGYDDEWFDVEYPSWEGIPSDYRIKPEPKYRPFKDKEECWNEMKKHEPFGYVKSKCDGSYNHYKLITKVSNSTTIGKTADCVIEFENDTFCHYHMVNLLDNYTFADGEPFGVKED